MKFDRNWLLLLATALGVPAILIGCRSRAELLTSTSVESPTRSVTRSLQEVDETGPQAESRPTESEDDAPRADSTDPSSTNTSPAAKSPRTILEAAGAVLEFDEQGRAVGLDLTSARLSPRVTRSIAELTHLQWADMRDTSVGDAELAVICALPQFELLALGNTRITDAGLQHLAQQHKLRFLSLDDTAVTDAGLNALTQLAQLEAVSLAGTRVTRSAAREFEQRQSACRVIIDDDTPEGPVTEPVATPHADPTHRIEPVPGDSTSTNDSPAWSLDNAPVPQVYPQPATTPPLQKVPQIGSDTGQTLNQVLQQRLLDPEVLTALSQHLMSQQEYARAAQALKALAALQPQNQQVAFDLGVALARSGQFDAAYPYLASLVGEATAYYNLGVIAFEQDQPEHSERFFARAIEASPNFAEARSWLDRVRRTTAISPAAHHPQPVNKADLVDLLMSEFGSVDEVPTANRHAQRSAAGITIVPGKTE